MSTAAGLKPIPFLIGGEWVQDASSHITHVNPATGEVNYQVCAGTETDIDLAVNSAHQAARQPAWRNMLPHQRAQILNRIAELMIEEKSHKHQLLMPRMANRCRKETIRDHGGISIGASWPGVAQAKVWRASMNGVPKRPFPSL